MPQLVLVGIMRCRVEALCSGWNNRLDSALAQIVTQPVSIIGFVAQKGAEAQAVNQGGHTGRFTPLSRHQGEAHQLARFINQSQNLGGQTTSTFPDRLILGPPFAP